jgi:hypothetical protein
VFKDGDKCVLLLKDRGKIFKSQLEEDWYEQAFGKKRNIMKYRMVFAGSDSSKLKPSVKLFAEVTYQMFPEHAKEFSQTKYESKFAVPLLEDEYSAHRFEAVIELPFGTVSSCLKFREEESEDKRLQDFAQASINQAFKTELEPTPTSQAD